MSRRDEESRDPKMEGRKVTHLEPEGGIRSIYANHVEVRTSPWDLRLGFGQIKSATAEELVIDEMIRVYLSPPQVKALSVVLEEQLRQYETKFGTIPHGGSATRRDQDDESDAVH